MIYNVLIGTLIWIEVKVKVKVWTLAIAPLT